MYTKRNAVRWYIKAKNSSSLLALDFILILSFKIWNYNLVCNCDPQGTEASICDKIYGECMCKDGYGGKYLIEMQIYMFL